MAVNAHEELLQRTAPAMGRLNRLLGIMLISMCSRVHNHALEQSVGI
ncbi:MAG: hypothetical protein IH787_02995 [Nitrospirae bacterium]|nr:hypothetical protein [Nitrospirota bacterium]